MKTMKLTGILFSFILSIASFGQTFLNTSRINGIQEEIFPMADGFMVFTRTSDKNLGVSFCEEGGLLKWQKDLKLLNRSSSYVVGENYGFVLNDQFHKSLLLSKTSEKVPIKIYRVDKKGEMVNSEDQFMTLKNDLGVKDFESVYNDGMFTMNDKLYLWWAVEKSGVNEYYLQKVNEDFSVETVKLKMKVNVADINKNKMSKPRLIDFDAENVYFTQMSFIEGNKMILEATKLNLDSMVEEELYEEVEVEQDEFRNFRSSIKNVKSKKATFTKNYLLDYKKGIEIYQRWEHVTYSGNVTYINATLNSFYDCVMNNGSVYYYGRHSAYEDETTGYWYIQVKANGEVVAAEVNDFLRTSHFEDVKLTGMHLYFTESKNGSMCIRTQKGTYLINLGNEIIREMKDEDLKDNIVEFPALADLTLDLNRSDRSVSTVVDNGKVYTSKIPKRGRLLRVDKFD